MAKYGLNPQYEYLLEDSKGNFLTYEPTLARAKQIARKMGINIKDDVRVFYASGGTKGKLVHTYWGKRINPSRARANLEYKFAVQEASGVSGWFSVLWHRTLAQAKTDARALSKNRAIKTRVMDSNTGHVYATFSPPRSNPSRARANPILRYYARKLPGGGVAIFDSYSNNVVRTVKTVSAARQVLASMNAKAARNITIPGASVIINPSQGTVSILAPKGTANRLLKGKRGIRVTRQKVGATRNPYSILLPDGSTITGEEKRGYEDAISQIIEYSKRIPKFQIDMLKRTVKSIDSTEAQKEYARGFLKGALYPASTLKR